LVKIGRIDHLLDLDFDRLFDWDDPVDRYFLRHFLDHGHDFLYGHLSHRFVNNDPVDRHFLDDLPDHLDRDLDLPLEDPLDFLGLDDLVSAGETKDQTPERLHQAAPDGPAHRRLELDAVVVEGQQRAQG
jgi:hypothetical protein